MITPAPTPDPHERGEATTAHSAVFERLLRDGQQEVDSQVCTKAGNLTGESRQEQVDSHVRKLGAKSTTAVTQTAK